MANAGSEGAHVRVGQTGPDATSGHHPARQVGGCRDLARDF